MIKVIPVLESRLNRGDFLLAARQITGKDHAKATDKLLYSSDLAEDMDIISDFAGHQTGTGVAYIGFLVAGLANEVDEVMEFCAQVNIAHVKGNVSNPLAKVIVLTGNVSLWGVSTITACDGRQTEAVREAFTQVYHSLRDKGLQHLFERFKRVEQNDGTILLLPSK